MSQEMSSDIGFGASESGNKSTNINNPKGSNLGAAKSAANNFISKARAVAGNLQGEIRTLTDRITLLQENNRLLQSSLDNCLNREGIEDDPDSVENMSHYSNARNS